MAETVRIEEGRLRGVATADGAGPVRDADEPAFWDAYHARARAAAGA